MQYAPIFITVYDRLLHLTRCIESLKKCPEAKFTTVYIASDGPARREDIEAIAEVRNYIKSIQGFHDVILIERAENVGADRNSNEGREEVYLSNDRLIRMEDDVVVGKGFLHFINSGLEFYNDHKNVVAICSYLPPGVENIQGQAFFLRGLSPYGFGRWRSKDSELYAKMSATHIESYFSSFKFFRSYERRSPATARSIPLIVNGDMRPGDILHGIVMHANNLVALYPPVSISKSIGNDGSGLNATKSGFRQMQKVSDERFSIRIDDDIAYSATMEYKLSKYLRKPGFTFLNYSIYLCWRFIPSSYSFYLLARSTVKKIRKLVR